MFRFIAADLGRQWAGALAITLIIALATALGVAVTLQERALRLGSARAAAAFDLIVGAPGSETQLVLSAVFLQPAPLPLVPGSVLAALLKDPRVAWAAPIGFGDFIEGQPIVGTSQALVEGIGGLSGGHSFRTLGEAVIGAEVPMAMGDTFHPLHGQAFGLADVHGAVSYTVVGRLASTGTPWDRAVLVPIEAVWRIHGQGSAHDGAARDGAPHDDPIHGDGADHRAEDGAPHAAPFEGSAPIRPEVLTDPHAPGLPAIVVKPRTIADAYKLRREYRSERTLAVFPAEVLTRLYATLGDARLVIASVALGAQALVAAAILLVMTVHVLQRRRQIGALRAFGAPRIVVFAIVWLEALLLLAVGLLSGFGIGFLVARIVSNALQATSGIAMPVAFEGSDTGFLLTLLLAGALVATLPALLAYRQSPASALRE